jgi:hypothetical protein
MDISRLDMCPSSLETKLHTFVQIWAALGVVVCSTGVVLSSILFFLVMHHPDAIEYTFNFVYGGLIFTLTLELRYRVWQRRWGKK